MDQQNGDGLIRNDEGRVIGIVCDGATYSLSPLQEDDFEEIERFLLERRKSPIEAIKAELELASGDPKLYQALIDRAYRDMRKHQSVDKVPVQEVKEYLDTREGTIHSWYLMLRRQDPSITLDRTKEIFRNVSTAEAQKRRDKANRELTQKMRPAARQPVPDEKDPSASEA